MSEGLRVTIFGANYWPEPTGIAPYTTGMAEGLASLGHKVTVVTSYPHYPAWSRPKGVPRKLVENRNGVRIERLRHYVPEDPSLPKRLAYELHVGARIASRQLRNSDVIICVSPLLFASRFITARARRMANRPAIGVVVQDIYSTGLAESRQGRSSRSIRAMRGLESRFLRGADGVSVIHHRFRKTLVEGLGVPEDQITVIRNWTHVPPAEEFDTAAFRAQMGWQKDEVIVLHAGAMGVKQGLDNVIAAARIVDHEKLPVRFVLMGDGGERRDLEEAADGVSALQFVMPLPDDDFRKALRAADFLLVSERAGVAEMSVPSKLTTYFAAGKPVIATTGPDGATAEELGRSSAGVRVAPGSPEELLAGVIDLAGNLEAVQQFSANGKRYASEKLSEESAIGAYDRWVRWMSEGRLPRNSSVRASR